jgi:hypothetical protein
MTLDGSN